jgi:hypothetical protein
MKRPSLLRDVIGFIVGGLVGAVTVGLVYVAFLGKPTGAHNGEDGAPLATLILFMFFAGGFIGRRGFNADFFSDLFPSAIGAYVVAAFLCVIAGLSFIESATMIGFVTVGVIGSAAATLLLMRRFPPKITNEG